MDQFRIDPDSPLTAWGQVRLDLQRRIGTGEFASAGRLPSESALSSEYGVSRATVRRCIRSLIQQGTLRSKRGSGTYISPQEAAPRITVHLLRPWREQLLATGHVARSRLIARDEAREVPSDLRRFVEHDKPQELRFGLHRQEVDGTPIAITESWSPADEADIAMARLRSAPAVASGIARIAFATPEQATALNTEQGTALFEVITCSRLRETGALAELARTSWVAGRVNLAYSRALTVGQIDMSELLSYGAQSPIDLE